MTDIKRYHGIYRGVVADNADPLHQTRLRVTIPQITGSGKDTVTDWAWPVQPSSVHAEVPPIGQGVWVSFIGGDPDHPIWHGSFGKNQASNKLLYIKPLPNSVDLSTISDYLVTTTQHDGTVEVDLMATLLAMANTLKSHTAELAIHDNHINLIYEFFVSLGIVLW